MKQFLNASEVAKLLEVDRTTVTRWIRRGVIRNVQRVPESRQWRIPLQAYEELVKQLPQ